MTLLTDSDDMQIARITTTIDDDSNGFRLALIPMALSSSDLSARSILHSTLAVACYHLGRPEEALDYKFRAIKDLSDSFASLSIDNVDVVTKTRHFAASMMLNVYGVSLASFEGHCNQLTVARSSMSLTQHGTCILKEPNPSMTRYPNL